MVFNVAEGLLDTKREKKKNIKNIQNFKYLGYTITNS